MQKSSSQALLIAVHDVTAVHSHRLERIERLLERLGVPAVTYLLVPNFHGQAPVEADRTFVDWCRSSRPYAVDWFLHGLLHQEDVRPTVPAVPERVSARAARRFLTDGEGEFLALRGGALATRMQSGVDVFTRVLGAPPKGFVAPAWLYNDELFPALERAGIRFTESHFHVFDLPAGRITPAPVITWATRSRLHRVGSCTSAAVERTVWRGRAVLRLALHPSDVDHPSIVASICRTLDVVRRDRQIATYEEIHAAPVAHTLRRRDAVAVPRL